MKTKLLSEFRDRIWRIEDVSDKERLYKYISFDGERMEFTAKKGVGYLDGSCLFVSLKPIVASMFGWKRARYLYGKNQRNHAKRNLKLIGSRK